MLQTKDTGSLGSKLWKQKEPHLSRNAQRLRNVIKQFLDVRIPKIDKKANMIVFRDAGKKVGQRGPTGAKWHLLP